ncbi:MAG: hypothetical protein ACYSUT_12845 [Planctomycetota bacterium]|jgi:hypothetical protein
MWKNKSRELIKSAPEIEDHDFIKIIEINGDNKQLAIAIRKVFADICKVPKEHINPETNFKAKARKRLCGWRRRSSTSSRASMRSRPRSKRRNEVFVYSFIEMLDSSQ